MSVETELEMYQREMKAGWADIEAKMSSVGGFTDEQRDVCEVIFNMGFIRGIKYEREES